MSNGERSAAAYGISVVVPVFNEAMLLDELRERLTRALENLTRDFEVVLVDDGSTDGTAERVDRIHGEDPRFRCVHLSRNFGHQAAVTAGLRYASGDLVFVMDGDLQDPPEVLPSLIAEWEKGSDVVYGFRENRKEHWLMVTLYHLFYRLLARLSTVAIPIDAGDFCLMSRVVVDEINRLPEKDRFIRGLRTWVGFKQSAVRYDRDVRAGGESKYSLTDLFRLAISGIVSFSDKPLIYVMIFGLLTSLVAFAYGASLVVFTMVFGGVITGYASLMAGLLFLGGIQLTSIGIVGIYISTLFKEVKARPTYIVASLRGLEVIAPDGGRVAHESVP
ncbi:MAG: glycosyltransferase family 2 protein [Myxococcales bacterium]|nr:glycosyltransferase family 2 protein [Myxococcales bacterium]